MNHYQLQCRYKHDSHWYFYGLHETLQVALKYSEELWSRFTSDGEEDIIEFRVVYLAGEHGVIVWMEGT